MQWEAGDPKRRAARAVVISLVLGLAVSVGVGWALWWFVDPRRGDPVVRHPPFPASSRIEEVAPFVWVERQPGCVAIHVSRIFGDSDESPIADNVPRWTGLWPRDWGDVDEVGGERTVMAYGWPRLSVFSRVTLHPKDLGVRGAFPARPIWSGLLPNATVFAGGAWLLLFGPGVWLRWVRRAQGSCPECGYHLRGRFETGCSECGWGMVSGGASR